uniref:Chemokine interleukin-8-like domain-containing protein n=1 Tax=Monopterus albus TaxID=43700 RepID=A0A3Q3JUU3_MONAL|nr:C-C motif chemokine 25-like [Monopterus albus]
MQCNTLFFLPSLSCLCLALAQVSYDDCCLRYVTHLNHKTQKHVVDYRRQETDGSCNIPAVIFIMKKGRMLCTNPKENWVMKLMKNIDQKKAKPSKTSTRKRRPKSG